jgi:hypothetical protein
MSEVQLQMIPALPMRPPRFKMGIDQHKKFLNLLERTRITETSGFIPGIGPGYEASTVFIRVGKSVLPFSSLISIREIDLLMISLSPFSVFQVALLEEVC